MGVAAAMGLVLFAALALAGAVGAAMAVSTFTALNGNLPDPASLERIELPQQSVVYDRTGTVELARFGEFNREVVTFDQIPPVLVDATTAVEDGTFWDNAGFDTLGILKAGLDSLRGAPRGASTITQQLVRQRLLSTDGSAQTEVSAKRKLREIIQSIRVTQAFPGEPGKQRIMAAYLNQNYYGNESYGVAAAARSYFGVELDDLTLAQAAILAALPKAPSSYDLVANAVVECLDPGPEIDDPEAVCKTSQLVVPDDAPIVGRRNLVLDLMEQGRTPLTGDRFTAVDFDAARAEKVVLAAQKSSEWKVPQFVWQVRKELTARLCPDAETCPALERGGLTVTSTLDLRLQEIADKWVKAATIVPHARNPKAAARRLGLDYEPWMANLRTKNLRNGALAAMDYQTGELLAYMGSADPTATKATKKFQPRFDVLADGWRQPGSTFKPVVYAAGIDERDITASTMFMDVVTDFGDGYTPTDADNLERGPVRVTDALRFSLNIPAVKAGIVIGNDQIEATAEAMGVVFRDGTVKAGASFPLGVEVVRPLDLIRAYGVLADRGRLVAQTTIRTVTDDAGETVISVEDRPEPEQVLDEGTSAIVTDILAGNTNPRVNPFWGRFRITEGDKRRPATLKTGTNNDARDLNAYGYIGAPNADERADGEYALVVGAWNGNSDNSLVSTPSRPLFSIDVTTHVWQGFLQEATEGWSINGFPQPDDLVRREVDPWTGLAAVDGAPSVPSLFLPGTAPTEGVPADTRCGAAVLETAGFEADHDNWMAANEGWMRRARRGPGVRGGPENTRTSYFYNGAFAPYGRSWGPLMGGAGCEPASPSPSVSIDPCASPDPLATVDPLATLDPLATPIVCPAVSPSPPASSEPTPELTPPPTEPPTEPPTPEPTPPPTEPPTLEPTPPPTDPPVEPPSAPA
jgi:membrane peptidoglycan carboxypeptidase